jgi:hypothetical protein
MYFRNVLLFLIYCSLQLAAQDNYEIQVYGSETVAPKRTMVEVHSNFTFSGSKSVVDGVIPTQHAVHETLEITQGLNSWSEVGFYVFTSYNPGYGYQWVGDHIRPRIRAPEEWKLPVGLSLSAEFGYQRHAFSQDTWTLELRPIIDKQFKKLYLSFNPTLERSLHGPSVGQGVTFSPNFKASYKIVKRIEAGLEYYGALGPVTGFDPFHDQEQQILPAIDIDFGPDWEFNAGVGVGVTHSTDHLLVKFIVGRRFSFGGGTKSQQP